MWSPHFKGLFLFRPLCGLVKSLVQEDGICYIWKIKDPQRVLVFLEKCSSYDPYCGQASLMGSYNCKWAAFSILSSFIDSII